MYLKEPFSKLAVSETHDSIVSISDLSIGNNFEYYFFDIIKYFPLKYYFV